MSDRSAPELLEAGCLLVANPLLPDPNFDRTVVLLMAYGDEGALGLVLNRPSETLLAAPLPRWEDVASSPAVVFVGGPVQHRAIICLARTSDVGDGEAAEGRRDGVVDGAGDGAGHGAGDGPDWNALFPDVGTLDMETDPSELAGRFSDVRIFAGYAGWAAGQLEGEVAQGAWWVVDAHPDDPFCDEPDELWKRVLRRQKGALALVAWFPDDPRMN